MEESLQDRVRKRLDELKLSPAAASIRSGLNRETIRKLLANEDQLPQGRTLQKLADGLDTTVQWLLDGSEDTSQTAADVRPADVIVPRFTDMPKDVPVFGTAAGSFTRGAFQLFEGVVDYVRRPPSLSTAKDVYALYVEGESMVPQFWPGDLIFVNPNKPPRFGDAVVIQMQTGEHEPVEATIGLYKARSTEKIVLDKHNPKAEIDINRTYVRAIHKVIGPNELYGV